MATINLDRRAEIGREKRAKTRTMLINSAIAVVSLRGFDAPTIDDFISAAGVARGTFYNYFETKSALLAAMAGQVADSVDSEILPLFEGIDDPARRIAIAIRQFIRISQREPDWGRILVRALPDVAGGWSDDMRRGVLQDIRRGKKLGQFHYDSIQAALALSIGSLSGAIHTALVEELKPGFAEAVAAMTLQALGMPAETARQIARLPLPQSAT